MKKTLAVATPLGNLEDMTFRAVRTLQEVDLIAAEDTRHSKKLLSHYHITTDIISCHEHNEVKRAEKLIPILHQGKDIALITDAGTPCISDPGFRLVTAVLAQNIHVVPIPGCCAVIAGLSAAGLPTDRFLFAGFLPRKHQQQIRAIQALAPLQATLIFYESPRRIRALIDQLMAVLGDRQACLAREITKLHEEFIRGTLSHVMACLDAGTPTKGECTLFLAGAGEPEKLPQQALETLLQKRLEQEHGSTAMVAKEISCEHKISKKLVYDTIVRLKSCGYGK
ncbi:MAG: 16S rRNA (cytidine(1402)-2'-O)-methyltransferase [Desulfobacteraceae bacterium]|nr:16S rRNA (cytidine(1402)-2'-O)-methyltransferase [Desulfobacteraceae bacterium]